MRRRVLLLIIVIIELIVTFNCGSRIIYILQAHRRISEFKIQRDLLAKKYESQLVAYQFIRTDTYIEKIARSKLGFAREGDYVYIIPAGKELKEELPKISFQSDNLSGSGYGEIIKWWKLFFN